MSISIKKGGGINKAQKKDKYLYLFTNYGEKDYALLSFAPEKLEDFLLR